MNKGFTIFFAMLVGSLTLAVGLAIFDLTVRQINLSATAAQSQLAIYAADAGAECAVYWDTKCAFATCTAGGAGGSAFATSSTDSREAVGATGVMCNGQNIAAIGLAAGTWPQPGATVSAATSSFTIYVSAQSAVSATTTCARVDVAKSGNPSQTTIISHGFNNCIAGSLQLERALQVSY